MKSLYIHIPFCEKKCLYCSFVVSVGQEHNVGRYLAALDQEASFYRGEKIDTIYVGGGTPSILSQPRLKELNAIIEEHFSLSHNAEKTIECNPEDIDEEKARALKDLGFNRISLGIQTLDDKYLEYLGRCHDSQRALSAVDCLKRTGFQNITLDLMYSFPGQTLEEIKDDVRRVVALESDHLSLYSLMIEKNSKFFAQSVQLDNEDLRARQYRLIVDELRSSGFDQYEISNFSKMDKESRHNMNYWQGGHYIGLGIGAHSHQSGRRSWNVSRLAEYFKRIEAGQSPEEGHEQLSLYGQFVESLLLGLRMNKGVSIDMLEKSHGCVLDRERRSVIERFIEQGFLKLQDGFVSATISGKLILDELCSRLI
jgi:oxygen-independent coproporphyrinogen-3 oxidase